MRGYQETLDALERGDPTLTELRIEKGFNLPIPGNEVGECDPTSEEADLSRLGAAIGSSRHLTSLDISGRFREEDILSEAVANAPEFLEGLKRNTSIVHLKLGYCSLSEGSPGYKILRTIQESSGYFLRTFSMHRCECRSDDDGAHALMVVLARCTDIEEIRVYSSSIDLETLPQFIRLCRGFQRLDILDFGGCGSVGSAVGEHLAEFLSDPSCNLCHLDLTNAFIGNAGASALAGALRNNTKLKTLTLVCNDIGNEGATQLANALSRINSVEAIYLDINSDITGPTWDAFTETLLDKSSVNATYMSNHSLHSVLKTSDSSFPRTLAELLRINRFGRRESAVRKIFTVHGPCIYLDIHPFVIQRGLKAMPYVVDWFDRAKACAEWTEHGENMADLAWLNAINHCIKTVPEELAFAKRL